MNGKAMAAQLLMPLLLAAACMAQAAELEVRIVRGPVLQKALPSGSGMSWHDGRFEVVGDDAPTLFTLDRRFAITARTPLDSGAATQDGRIAKNLKPDYEAMAGLDWNGRHWNLILGSGSRHGTRELGLLVAADGAGPTLQRDMAPLYRALAARAGFAPDLPVNIEALAIARGQAFLFNRGNAGRNIVFQLALADLVAYMRSELPSIERIALHEATLPALRGLQAGFSGADHWPEIGSLVFTASVEAADNAYDDGKVLGSFIGLIALDALDALPPGRALDLRRGTRLLMRDGAALKTKVESIALVHTGPRLASGALVSDNDDGSSQFFDVLLTLTSPARR